MAEVSELGWLESVCTDSGTRFKRDRSAWVRFTASGIPFASSVGYVRATVALHETPSPNTEEYPMRIIGIVFVVLGIIALAVPTFTFMTTEHAVNTSFLQIDYQKPHTIVLNPI